MPKPERALVRAEAMGAEHSLRAFRVNVAACNPHLLQTRNIPRGMGLMRGFSGDPHGGTQAVALAGGQEDRGHARSLASRTPSVDQKIRGLRFTDMTAGRRPGQGSRRAIGSSTRPPLRWPLSTRPAQLWPCHRPSSHPVPAKRRQCLDAGGDCRAPRPESWHRVRHPAAGRSPRDACRAGRRRRGRGPDRWQWCGSRARSRRPRDAASSWCRTRR